MPKKNPSEKDETKLRHILSSALEVADPKERQHFLDNACGDDAPLREQIESLIQAHDKADDFLNSSVFGDETGTQEEAPGAMIGPYRLVEKLGEGGFGTVYLAAQETPVQRQVALKIIKTGMNTKQVIARFAVERQALAMMDHPHIAHVYEAGATNSGRPFFVMELVEGKPITDFCDAHRLNMTQRLDLFLQVCDAVQHAHQKGIIHRDLKPSNIVIAQQDGIPQVKVIDFGIAKSVHTPLIGTVTLTHDNMLLGTPTYMSPEQADLHDKQVDIRSDVYALGVLLYELMTGAPPFEQKRFLDAGLDEMRRILREEEPSKPSTKLTKSDDRTQEIARNRATETTALRRSLEGDLDWIAIKALEKERDRRYQTVNALRLDLERYRNQEPVTACPPSIRYQCRKWIHRNKVAFIMATVIMAALITVALVSTVSFWQTRTLLSQQRLRSAQQFLENGRINAGIHWLVKALETSPPGNASQKQVIQANIAHWNQQWRKPEQVFSHEFVLLSAAIAPDGDQIATGDAMGNITLWDVASGKKTNTRNTGLGAGIWHIEFSPDGYYLLTRTGQQLKGTIQLWSRESVEPIGEALHSIGIREAAFSPDSRMFVAGEGANSIRLRSTATGESISSLMSHTNSIQCLTFSPDGKTVVTGAGGEEGLIRFWSVDTGMPSLPDLSFSHPSDLQFSRDGRRFAASSHGGKMARVFAFPSLDPVGETLKHDAPVSRVAFHPNGDRLLTACEDFSARQWDVTKSTLVGNPMRHDGMVKSVCYSPDGAYILTSAFDRSTRLWSTHDIEPVATLMGHRSRTSLGAWFDGQGRRILTAGITLACHVWSAPPYKKEGDMIKHPGIFTVRLSPDEKWLVSASWWQDGIQTWEASTGKKLPITRSHSGGVWMIRFHPDGRFATAGVRGRALIWDIHSEKPEFELRHENAEKQGVRSVDFSPGEGRFIATGSFDRTACVWDASNGSKLVGPLQHPGIVEDVQFLNEDTLITACSDGKIRVWTLWPSPKVTETLQLSGAPIAMDLNPDNTLLAVGGYDRVVTFFNMKTMKQSGATLVLDDVVSEISFSPDSQFIATIATHIGQIWSVASREQTGPALPFDMSEATFTKDGSKLIICETRLGIVIQDFHSITSAPWKQHPRLWAEVTTHMEMDENGALSWIEREDWEQKKEALDRLNAGAIGN